MYRKNTAGQFIVVQLILTATGAVGTGLTPAARRCLDGTFGAGGGTYTEDGTTGSYKYAMAQADSNANDCSIITTATGCIPVVVNFVTTAADPTDSVRFGLTALPNATVSGVGGLLTAPTTANVGLADLSRILGTALTETAGQIAAAFKKWFDVATPSGTVNSIPNATAGAAGGLFIAGTNAATTITTALTTTFTGSLTGSVASVTGLTAATVHSDLDDIQARLPAALTGAGNMKSDALALNGDTTSAANIAKTTRAIGRGTATTAGSSTTLIATSAFLPVGVAANTDQFANRVITFDADTTTTKLRGQSTIISSSSAAAAPVFTVVAITIAPVDGDTFSVT